jgi:F-box protein 36
MASLTEMASPRIDLERPGVTPEMKERNRISRAQKLYEKTAVAPAPSKDFYEVLVTELGVVLRWWKITVRQRQKAAPGEMVASWENFQDDKR